jgi:SAM-dependent methyltransferase
VGARVSSEAVIWHDLECGGYSADLADWLELAGAAQPDAPVLDVGAGTGRVALALARAGHEVIALERDDELAAELARRGAGLAIEVLCADACAFALARAVALAIVPMQTIHLLVDRPAFLRCVHAALAAGGLLAVSLLGEGAEPFEFELEPDTVELGEVRYESAPTALRREPGGAVLLERRRSRIAPAGPPSSQLDLIRLERCDVETLTAEARAAGFEAAGVRTVAATAEHAGSEIVFLEARA